MITTLILFFILLSVLIISHECGHFFSARVFGIRVDEFGFGLPPRITGIMRNGTLYSINWLPFGGFVKIHGEKGDSGGDQNSFANKPAWARSLVLLAGVLSNIVLAFILMSAVVSLGMPQAIDEAERSLYPDAELAISGVVPGGSADKAGIQAGDYIRTIAAENAILVRPQKISDIQELIKQNTNKEVIFKIKRDGQNLEKSVLVRANSPSGEGPTGIELSWVHTKKVIWYMMPIEGAKLTYNITNATVEGLWGVVTNLFSHGTPGVEVAGPVGIFNLVGSTRHAGISSFLFFMAVLSINLALINVLPIPGLDGGRFLFVIIEAIRGKRISQKVSAITHGLGFIALLVLMLFITFLDIAKVF